MSNKPFENNRIKSKEILKIIHTDLNGPHITGFGGEIYFVTFVDALGYIVSKINQTQ